MFTQQQLALLIKAETENKFYTSEFLLRLPEVGEQSDMSGEEFDTLMQVLEAFTYEEIRDLRIALKILSTLPNYKM